VKNSLFEPGKIDPDQEVTAEGDVLPTTVCR